jgi:leucyl-tRNA synthetase
VPWDPQFVIESLSDSTIYMAYYTIAHIIQGNDNMEGESGNVASCYTPSLHRHPLYAAVVSSISISISISKSRWFPSVHVRILTRTFSSLFSPLARSPRSFHSVGPHGIKPEDLTVEVFNYVFLNKDSKNTFPKTAIKKDVLEGMRSEFEYWYPMDMRVSGKDLIPNHLTMSLYTHSEVWSEDRSKWPRSMYGNGHIMVDAMKMSKVHPLYPLYTHYTLTIHPLHTHYTPTIHPLYTHNTLTTHSLYAPSHYV